MSGGLTIIGCGLGPGDLTTGMREAILNAEVLAGGRRHLSWFPGFNGQREIIDAGVEKLVPRLMDMSRGQRVVVLASGDPLFFGIGRLFAERLPAESLVVIPNVTAAQAACGRLGLPWEQCRFFSVHGRYRRLPWSEILRSRLVVVYADAVRTPAAIARELLGHWPAAAGRQAVLAANLGSAEEHVYQASLAEIAVQESSGLSMLILLPGAGAAMPPLGLGRPDADYEHQGGLITGAEVRVVAISKLRLVPGVMWDVGAGSGSVGIEAANLCPGLDVYAVEKDEQRRRQIFANAETFGCSSLEVFSGSILDCLDQLPAPERVFVGGGGRDIQEICQRIFSRLQGGGVMVVAAVTLETRASLTSLLPGYAVEVVEIAVSRAKKLAGYRLPAAENSVCLFCFEKALGKGIPS